MGRRRDVQLGAAGQRADGRHGLRRADAGLEPCRAVVHAPVAGQRDVVAPLHQQRAVLACVVPEHAHDDQRRRLAVQG